MTPNYGFRITTNRTASKWVDVHINYNLESLEKFFSNISNFDQLLDGSYPEITDLFTNTIKSELHKGPLTTLENQQVQVVSCSNNVLTVKATGNAIYGNRTLAEAKHIQVTTAWTHKLGSSTFVENSPCMEHYTFELKFMEI